MDPLNPNGGNAVLSSQLHSAGPHSSRILDFGFFAAPRQWFKVEPAEQPTADAQPAAPLAAELAAELAVVLPPWGFRGSIFFGQISSNFASEFCKFSAKFLRFL